jgi:ATP-dependent DNA ligase
LRSETPASFVAFDLLAEGDEDLRGMPFAERRRRLERLFAAAAPPLLLTPLTTDFEAATAWLDRFTGRGVDGVVAKRPEQPYVAGRREWIKVKPERTADCVVAGFRLAGPRQVVSLLLGLYGEDGLLRHVGVASSFTGEVRRALYEDLEPLVVQLAGHPWELGFGIERRPMGRLRGAAGVWTPEMPLDWVPIRPDLVAEVVYGQLDVDRFRQPARFVRWRPDRRPESCRFDQLHVSGHASALDFARGA